MPTDPLDMIAIVTGGVRRAMTTVVWSRDLAGTGFAVNALVPGGPANTRVILFSKVTDCSRLVQAAGMTVPSVWLMSARSDGVTGRRIIAKEWDAEREQRQPADDVGGTGESGEANGQVRRQCNLLWSQVI